MTDKYLIAVNWRRRISNTGKRAVLYNDTICRKRSYGRHRNERFITRLYLASLIVNRGQETAAFD